MDKMSTSEVATVTIESGELESLTESSYMDLDKNLKRKQSFGGDGDNDEVREDGYQHNDQSDNRNQSPAIPHGQHGEQPSHQTATEVIFDTEVEQHSAIPT